MSKSFTEAMPERDNIMIVDGFNLAFRYKHANKRHFAMEYLQTVASFANSYGAEKVVVLSDGGSNYRERIYPGYKGDRKELRKLQTEEEAKKFQEFMEDWTVAFDLCGTEYITVQYKGVEADDIAAYLATDNEILQRFEHVWLLSTDKDWDLLVTDKVSKFSYRTRKETRLDNWHEHYTYEPKEHISVKVLQGDKSDTIPGVVGVGEKRAAALVSQYGSAYDIHSCLPINDKKIYIQNLNKFGDQLLLNYELMDLVEYCEEAIGDNLPDLQGRIEEIII